MDAGIKVGSPLVGTWRTIGQDSSAHIKESGTHSGILTIEHNMAIWLSLTSTVRSVQLHSPLSLCCISLPLLDLFLSTRQSQ